MWCCSSCSVNYLMGVMHLLAHPPYFTTCCHWCNLNLRALKVKRILKSMLLPSSGRENEHTDTVDMLVVPLTPPHPVAHTNASVSLLRPPAMENQSLLRRALTVSQHGEVTFDSTERYMWWWPAYYCMNSFSKGLKVTEVCLYGKCPVLQV